MQRITQPIMDMRTVKIRGLIKKEDKDKDKGEDKGEIDILSPHPHVLYPTAHS